MKTDVGNKRNRNFGTAAGIFLGRLRIAFRGLWKKPLITVSAIISTALGIGAATAMFTIYDEYLLRPLPVPKPERLVNFSGSFYQVQEVTLAAVLRAALRMFSVTRCFVTWKKLIRT